MNREGFIFYKYIYDAIDKVDKETKAEILVDLCEYMFYGKEPEDMRVLSRIVITLASEKLERGKKILDKKNGRHCSEYQGWRKAVFERDDYTCQMCGARGCELNAHHIMPFAGHPSLRYEIDNGVTLCKRCHKEVHADEG